MTLGRFAPSPTGVLHVGNLRTALASWLSTRQAGGRWIVRMEDVDGPRCHHDLGEAQLRDLSRLGLDSDVEVVWQSDRSTMYREALAALHQASRLYPCVCTRKDLQMLASAPHGEDGLRPYPGQCRSRPWEGFEHAIRLRLPDGSVTWEDRLMGPQSDDPLSLTGDPLLFRRDGCFAYHLAVVVDDGGQGVTEVVRGADLRAVTATQIRLQEALGLPTPTYAHLGLVCGADGGRLGKRAGAPGLAALQARGVASEVVLGWLGWSLGCMESPTACSVEELVGSFDWARVPRGEVRIPDAWL
jgi:glutamyl-queuosine tRNA(Asp) synthetase